MSKPKRGKNIKKIENWRGICPVCNRTGVKLLWTKLVDGKTINCCKVCGK